MHAGNDEVIRSLLLVLARIEDIGQQLALLPLASISRHK